MRHLRREAPEVLYDPAPPGLYAALQDAIVRHADAVLIVPPKPAGRQRLDGQDSARLTGGERLTLYLNRNDPSETLTIAPVGRNAEERTFDISPGLHYTHQHEHGLSGGTYEIHDESDGVGLITWCMYPEVTDAANLGIQAVDRLRYSRLIQKVGNATVDKPAEPRRRLSHILGDMIDYRR